MTLQSKQTSFGSDRVVDVLAVPIPQHAQEEAPLRTDVVRVCGSDLHGRFQVPGSKRGSIQLNNCQAQGSVKDHVCWRRP